MRWVPAELIVTLCNIRFDELRAGSAFVGRLYLAAQTPARRARKTRVTLLVACGAWHD